MTFKRMTVQAVFALLVMPVLVMHQNSSVSQQYTSIVPCAPSMIAACCAVKGEGLSSAAQLLLGGAGKALGEHDLLHSKMPCTMQHKHTSVQSAFRFCPAACLHGVYDQKSCHN